MHTLETQRLLLRPFHPEDLAEVTGWADAENRNAAAEAQVFLDFCFREYRQGGFGPWGMELKETRRIVGNCGFPHIRLRDGCGEVNYFVAPQYRGLGLAPEALKALLEHGFKQLGLRRIEARCELDNIGSERVMQKVGMRFDRLLRPGVFAQPNYRLYSLARPRNTWFLGRVK